MSSDKSLEEDVQKMNIADKRSQSQDSGISSKHQLSRSSRGAELDTQHSGVIMQRQHSGKDATIKGKVVSLQELTNLFCVCAGLLLLRLWHYD